VTADWHELVVTDRTNAQLDQQCSKQTCRYHCPNRSH